MNLCKQCAIERGLNKSSVQEGNYCDACSRRIPPSRHQGNTHKVNILGMRHSAFVTINHYEDGSPCEVFVSFGREGSQLGELIQTMGMMVSLAFQHGANVATIINMLEHYPNTAIPYVLCEALKREYIDGYYQPDVV